LCPFGKHAYPKLFFSVDRFAGAARHYEATPRRLTAYVAAVL